MLLRVLYTLLKEGKKNGRKLFVMLEQMLKNKGKKVCVCEGFKRTDGSVNQ